MRQRRPRAGDRDTHYRCDLANEGRRHGRVGVAKRGMSARLRALWCVRGTIWSHPFSETMARHLPYWGGCDGEV